ncbi:MAG: aceF [Gammaproteobacteria bacterium]|jgi:pyruvate dehydrogenase E2 component (dihydrolipoamide acetyltransferase)|nr:aceF [Gammaproteobacteria bacterium]
MSNVIEVKVPDIGQSEAVDVIEVCVKAGDTLAVDDAIITLESDKASMDVPSPYAGVVESVRVKVGDKVTEGNVILILKTEASIEKPVKEEKVIEKKEPEVKTTPVAVAVKETAQPTIPDNLHAGPAVRRLARELDLDLRQIPATGPKGRISKEDVKNYVQARMQGGGGGFALPAAPQIDFAQFGAITIEPLSKIKKLSGANLHRNWVTIPHVTQFDEADITNLEAFRVEHKAEVEKQGFKLTPLVFIMKAVAAALKKMPQFNASLSADGASIVLKHYVHLGVAVDTPNGLVVPVVRDVDTKSVLELAAELASISERARNKALKTPELQGSSFSISSLGGIGGTAFTPIINAPDVAILGVSKASYKPVYAKGSFVPRLMLPLSLSYDHRVIDGADGARFCRQLVEYIEGVPLTF